MAPDWAVARLAARQHGVVSVRQLAAAGFSPNNIWHRARTGRLHRVHRGVYAVGHRNLTEHGRWLAAVLACGEGAVLSHRSAAALWEIRPYRGGLVEVTIKGHGGRRPRAGILVHRSCTLDEIDVTRRKAIPVTTPARTIADLRRVLPRGQVQKAMGRAEAQRLPLGGLAGLVPDRTASGLERRFLRVIHEHGLPTPEVNVRVGPYVVDFLWRGPKLVVEIDSFRWHGDRGAFEADRARDAKLALWGYEVVRFTDLQLEDDTEVVSATVRSLLASREVAHSSQHV